MIRCDERQPRPRQLDPHNLDPAGVVDVIEVEHRKQARVGSPTPEVVPQVDAVQLFGQQRGRQTSHPFVEVAQHQFGPRDMAVEDDGRQALCLMPPLENCGAEVDVVHMQCVTVERDVRPLQPPRLARLPRQIVLEVMRDRVAAEHGIPELMPTELACRRHDPSHAESGADLLGVADATRPCADHFLQRDDVGLDRVEHRRDAMGPRPAVESAASVNVVRDDAERRRAVTHYAMIVVTMRGAIIALVVAASAGCSERPRDPLQLDRNILTVDNRTSTDWTDVEIWLNTYYRITVRSIPAKSRFQAPLDTFVAGFGQRFNFHSMQVKDLRLTGKLPDGKPLEIKKQFEASGLAGVLRGAGGKQ